MFKNIYRNYFLITLLIVYIFNFVDRQIVALLMEPIKHDLGLSDTQLGFMSGIAFALFYTVVGLPIARLADRGNRVSIIAIAIALWSGMTALSGLATNFWQLAAARIGVGIGEAGCTPPAHSLISDYFPPKERSRAIAIYMMGVPLGVLFGFLIGGWVNELYGWRVAFIALGLPGIVMAIVVKLTLREPVRGQFEQGEYAETGLTYLEAFKSLWASKAYRHLVVAMSLTAFVGSGIGQWEAAFFIRNHGMTTGELGTWLALMGGAAGAVGIFAGGEISQRLGGENMARQTKVVMYATLLMIIPGFAAFMLENKYLALLSLGLLNILYFVHYGPGFSAILSLVPANMRATASALTLLLINLIGAGLGPQVIGLLSDSLQGSVGNNSLRFSLLLVLLVIFAAAFYFYRASKQMAIAVSLEQNHE